MLTPEEISSRQFLVQLRGYDRDEVHAFLGEVSAEVADLRSRLTELEADLEAATDPSQAPAPVAGPEAAPEATPSALFAEIGLQTQRILEAAQEAGDEIRRTAQAEAEAARDAAVAEASGTVDSARAEAERLVAEGERRRGEVDELVRGLATSRDRLVSDLRGVGQQVEQALRDLGAPAEAAPADSATAEPPAEGSVSPEPAAGGPPTAEPPSAEAAEPVPGEPSSHAAPGARTESEGATPGDDVSGPQPASEPEMDPDEGGTPSRGTGPRQQTLDTVEIDPAADQAAGGSPSGAASVGPDAAAAPAESGDLGGLRAEALAPLHPRMVRRLQRGLQGLHDVAADRVRQSKGQGDVEPLLPTGRDIDDLGRVAGEFLDQAYAAGTRAATTLAGRDVPTPSAPGGLGSDFAAEALRRVHGGLREALTPVLAEGSGVDALADRVRVVFDHVKGTDTEELAATRLIAAYEAGVTDALQAGGLSREAVARPGGTSGG